MGTTATPLKKGQRHVRFQDEDQESSVKIIHYSKEDILQSWYSKKEYQAFMKDVKLTLEVFPYLQKKKDSLSPIDKNKLKSICITGAEQPRIILKMQTRKLIVKSVIQQQKIN